MDDIRMFSPEELQALAAWEPIQPGFGPDEALVQETLRSIQENLAGLPSDVFLLQEGDSGMSSYVAFFVYAPEEPKQARRAAKGDLFQVPGILVYLSLFAPVGVFGRGKASVFSHGHGWSGLRPEDVQDASDAAGPVEAHIVDVVRRHGYSLLGREAVSQSLPPGIRPFEYCLCDEPWDRVFHVLFANTD